MLDRIEIGRIRRQKYDQGARGFDERANASTLVGGEIVEDDDVAFAEFGENELLNVCFEDIAVHTAAKNQRSDETTQPDPSCQRHTVAPVFWYVSDGALSALRSSIGSCHREIDAALVEEEET